MNTKLALRDEKFYLITALNDTLIGRILEKNTVILLHSLLILHVKKALILPEVRVCRILVNRSSSHTSSNDPVQRDMVMIREDAG